MKAGLNIGDWVLAKTREGELIQGYINDLDVFQNKARVQVTESDNADINGKGVWILNSSIEKLKARSEGTEDQLLAMIDLALLTKDKEWFLDLTQKLQAKRSKSKEISSPIILNKSTKKEENKSIMD
ncbi:IDEAL domain-containing protein [Peribacillus kribbensis]|uniref:IDEAL domain-containing protein n=1 Tax=Peribacillus kribbensis TaxID=356658 RepID=UPI0003F9B383|nr:IDEAL domain-containing protein [Peribacillus kribbensis]